MGILKPLILTGAFVGLFAKSVKGVDNEDPLKCTGNTFYRVKKSGQVSCKECPACEGGGIGWNTSEKRHEDEHGFRSCYSCALCKPGTYRELHSKDSTCKPCSLDCTFKRRYGSVKCGGAIPGHCGDCLTGYYADSKEPNSRCTLKLTPANVESSTTYTDIVSRSGEMITDDSYSATVLAWIPIGILFILTVVVLICGVFSALYQKRAKKNRQKASTGLVSDSSKALISSGSSFGEDNLETDGVHNFREKKVRGELPEVVTINEIEGFQQSLSFDASPFNNRILKIDDETITVVAQNVIGERRHELFDSYLKIEKSKTSPEEEKWEKNIHTFADYIREVLKVWIHNADKQATLKALCVALEMASFHDVVEKVLKLPENQPVFLDDLKECSDVSICTSNC